MRESEPRPLPGAHWDEPAHQPSGGTGLVPGQRDRETPVFSSALPPAGLSGALRRAAHRIPDHRLGHWMLLMLADRVDVVEHLSFAGKRRGKPRIPGE